MKQICDVVKNVPLFKIADSWLAKRKSGFIFIVGFIVGYSRLVSGCSYSLYRHNVCPTADILCIWKFVCM